MLSGIHLSTVLKDSDILSEETTHLLVTSLPKPDSCLSRSPTTIRAIAALPARRRPLTHRWSDLAILRPQKTKRRDNELQFVDFRGHGSRSLWFYIYVSEYFCNYLFMAKYNLVNQGLRGPPTANYHFRHRQLTRMCPLTRSM